MQIHGLIEIISKILSQIALIFFSHISLLTQKLSHHSVLIDKFFLFFQEKLSVHSKKHRIFYLKIKKP